MTDYAALRYNGLAIVGICKHCGMFIWGKEGEKKEAHMMCDDK